MQGELRSVRMVSHPLEKRIPCQVWQADNKLITRGAETARLNMLIGGIYIIPAKFWCPSISQAPTTSDCYGSSERECSALGPHGLGCTFEKFVSHFCLLDPGNPNEVTHYTQQCYLINTRPQKSLGALLMNTALQWVRGLPATIRTLSVRQALASYIFAGIRGTHLSILCSALHCSLTITETHSDIMVTDALATYINTQHYWTLLNAVTLTLPHYLKKTL